ncbi:MAG: hypothetical protein U0L91_09790 [Gemmiger sp.]|uniref:hypothetical protein n=1 Tax=Gemmiger sp. TaxID=2049027 RepID=UPI002E7A5B4D|nr:hypothetical protein [Gemmiger sp.]MEE0801555.1 hypothetical protein [Gemmiger sp.]
MRFKNKQSPEKKENTIRDKICRFRPPLILSCLGALIFCTASLVAVSTQREKTVPAPILYSIYVLAAIFLFAAIWAVVLLFKNDSPFQAASGIAHRHILLSKLLDDDTFRIVSVGYGSLVFNSVLAASKIVAGWWFSSKWLMVLAGYYLVLCVTKFLILRNARAETAQFHGQSQFIKEWKAYRLCGGLLVVLSFALQGVAIMIVKEGNGFRYHGYLIFVVALYDFYCLITSVVYLVRKRKVHSPAIMAIKYISLATSLVSMLSLQTAMFASFDQEMTLENQQLMNLLTGTAVCGILAVLGVAMVMVANKRLKNSHTP